MLQFPGRLALRLSLAVCSLWLLAAAGPVQAAFIPIALPDAAYTSGTTLIPISAADLTILASVTDGTQTVAFAPSLQARTLGPTWDTWGPPPFTEGNTPGLRVLFSQRASAVTLTLSQPSDIFGFEAEPNSSNFSMTADFYNGATFLGEISQVVVGDGGARLFAAQTTSPTLPIDTVFFRSPGTDFAIARLRYHLAPAAAVPEPSTLALTGLGMLGIFGWLRRRKKSG